METNAILDLDPPITSLVQALRAHGIATYMSCAGHLDRGTFWPWVTIRPSGARQDGWAVNTNLPLNATATSTYQHIHRLLANHYDHGRAISEDEIYLDVKLLGAGGMLQLGPSVFPAGAPGLAELRRSIRVEDQERLLTRCRVEVDAFDAHLRSDRGLPRLGPAASLAEEAAP